MSESKLYVLAGLKRGADGHARVVAFGPTSESVALLHGYQPEPGGDVVAVLRVLPGGLLRVAQADADRALSGEAQEENDVTPSE